MEKQKYNKIFSKHTKNINNLRKFLEKIKNLDILSEKDENGKNLIHHAVINKCKECVDKLIELNVDVNSIDLEYSTPLHYSATLKNSDILITLLKHNADVNVKDIYYFTPLHVASLHNNKKGVSLLLKYKANPNLQDKIGRTPLHIAAEMNYIEIVDLLITKTNLFIKDMWGNTAYDIAKKENFGLIKYFLKDKMIRYAAAYWQYMNDKEREYYNKIIKDM